MVGAKQKVYKDSQGLAISIYKRSKLTKYQKFMECGLGYINKVSI